MRGEKKVPEKKEENWARRKEKEGRGGTQGGVERGERGKKKEYGGRLENNPEREAMV